MKTLLAAVSAFALVLSCGANALVKDGDLYKSGELKVVDAEKRVVMVNDTKYQISEDTKIVIDGKVASFEDLKEVQTVSYKVRELESAE